MSGETYVCVVLGENDEPVELPAEEDGTLLLSVVQSQFEGASGLKFRNPVSGAWRGIRISDNMLYPPAEGWKETKYVVVSKPQQVSEEIMKKERREEKESVDVDYREREPLDFGGGYSNRLNDHSKPIGDVIVLGLKYDVTENDFTTYFKQFGDIAHAEIKYEMNTKKSRGFGFLRYESVDVQDKVMGMTHSIKGRRCELKPPRKTPGVLPCKFFVGCLPNSPEASVDELRDYFSRFGRLSDIYIPKPYRGFGFVTFHDGYDAQKMNNTEHTLRGYKLNVNVAEPKTTKPGGIPPQQQPTYGSYQVAPQQQLSYQAFQPTHPTTYSTGTTYLNPFGQQGYT